MRLNSLIDAPLPAAVVRRGNRSVFHRARRQRADARLVDFNAMARLLAKTGYAYCFAEFGGCIGEFGGVRAGYRPLVLDLIAGDPDCCPTRCIGCVPGNPPAKPEPGMAHRMSVSDVKAPDGTDYLVVNIRLFGLLPGPIYRVAVAEQRR